MICISFAYDIVCRLYSVSKSQQNFSHASLLIVISKMLIDQKSISRYDTKVAKELMKNGIKSYYTILY